MSHMQLLALVLRMQWPLIKGLNEAPVSQGLCQSGKHPQPGLAGFLPETPSYKHLRPVVDL